LFLSSIMLKLDHKDTKNTKKIAFAGLGVLCVRIQRTIRSKVAQSCLSFFVSFVSWWFKLDPCF